MLCCVQVEIPHSPRDNDDGNGDDTDGDQIVSTVEDIQFDVDMVREWVGSVYTNQVPLGGFYISLISQISIIFVKVATF